MKKNVKVIQSIQRAIDIINIFDDDQNYHLTLNDISKKLNLNINTARGIINTLVLNGFIEHDLKNNTYSLGLIYIPKSNILNSHSIETLRELIKPELDTISEKYEVSARFQIVSNSSIFTVETSNPSNAHYVVFTKMHKTFPLNATSSGKIFLLYQSDEKIKFYFENMDKTLYTENTIIDPKKLYNELQLTKQRGYALEFEEMGRGVSSIAVPIILKNNNLYGTISITTSSSIIKYIYENTLEEVLYDLKKCCKIVSDKVNSII